MPLRILHAADASAAADALPEALRRERNREATVLLASAQLESATNKNDILRDALAAANDRTLVVVRVDAAEAPIGTRDAPSIDWASGADARSVRDAIAKSLPKAKAGSPLGCFAWSIATLVAVAFVSLYFLDTVRSPAPMSAGTAPLTSGS